MRQVLFALLVAAVSSGDDRQPTIAPPLAAPRGTVVRVSTEPQLQGAVRELHSNTTILVAPGTYRLTATLAIEGTLSDIAIRGATNNSDDVVLVGEGMEGADRGNVPFGIYSGGDVKRLLIANMTLRDFRYHAIIFNAGTQSPHVYNVHLVDAGRQFIKSNPDQQHGGGVNDGLVEYSVIEYSTTAPGTYTNGIDVHAGANWIIRNNVFRNITATSGLAGPAVLMWNHSSNTATEGNLFLNCARGIVYGLQIANFDHHGGIIRNNVFFRSKTQPGDVGISVADSPDTQVLNNTVFVSGTYATPIEYRFAGTRHVTIANNLLDGTIKAREGATGVERDNVAGATGDMFVDAAAGDLRLSEPAARGMHDAGASGVAGRAAPVPAPAQQPHAPKGLPPASRLLIERSKALVNSPHPTSVAPQRSVASEGPRRGRLVYRDALAYEGSFRVPAGTIGGSMFDYGGYGLAYSAERRSLFVSGHDHQLQVAEVGIPAIRQAATVRELATAPVLQPFTDATSGRLGEVGSGRVKIGGLLPYRGRLYLSAYVYYDATASQTLSHFAGDLDLRSTAGRGGPFQVGTRGAGMVSGYFGVVPADWQAALGGTVINGNCCLPIISRTSFGPSAFAIDPLTIGASGPAPAVPLLYYPANHPLLEAGQSGEGWNLTSTLFNGTSEVRGVVFPEATASVLFFGRQGVGSFCYGPGVSDSARAGQPADGGVDRTCYDPADSSKGTHAYPYVYYVWAYDANDLAAVKAGRTQPWDVRPYATWPLDLPFAINNAHLNGAAYDPETGRIFVAQAFGDGDRPLIHVLRVRKP